MLKLNKINKQRRRIWIIFFLVKFIYLCFAVFIYSKLTPLGDTSLYLNPPRMDFNLINSTELMFAIVGNLNKLFGSFITHLFFMLISFYGIYKSLSILSLSNKSLLFFLFIFSLPSFAIWTSIISKESIMVFSTGIFFFYIIRWYDYKINPLLNPLFYISIYIITLFKPQYLIPILFFIFILKIYKFSHNIVLPVVLILYLVFIFINYKYIYIINDISLNFGKYFDSNAGSARPDFWIDDFDFYTKMYYGIFLAFLGPSIFEVFNKIFYLPFFIESCFLLLIYMYTISQSKNKFNITYFVITFSIIFLFLFFHYPFGILNIGAGIRYREGFLLIMILFVYYVYYKLGRKE